MTKIDWSTAPEWAKYVSMDECGVWMWHEDKPNILQTMWGSWSRVERVKLPEIDWKNTLQERPVA